MTERTTTNEAELSVPEPSWEEGLAALYDSSASKLLLYGRALGLSHGEAEDVLHDVFAALLRLTQTPDNPEHYLVRSFRNRSLNHRRGWWRRLARELESSRWFEPAEAASAQEVAAVQCLTRLPVEQREVIVLKVWHQLTFEAIGSLQDVSPNTAAGRYRYGLQKIRSCLLKTSIENEIDDETFPRSGIGSDTLTFAGISSACRGHS